MKIRKTVIYTAALLLAGTAVAAERKPAAPTGLATDIYVNGQPISVNHILLMSSGLDPENKTRKANDADSQSAARAELVTQELLAQEARKAGIDKNPVIADQLAFQSRVILSRAYLEDYFARNPITDATLKTAYEWKRANGKLQEYKTRHILFTSADQAEEVIAKLDKGEDFVALAKRYSQDPGGQSNGGDLGWFRPDQFVDHHFTDAIESLKKGQYTKKPVRTRFGWHVIKVEEAPRAANAESFDSLHPNAKEALRQKAAQVRIEELTSRLAASAKLTGPGATTQTARRNK